MKEIREYINSLSIDTLVDVYENEYLPFKKTGICPDGVLRKIARMFNEVSGTYSLRFAEERILETCTEIFYNQNKK